MSRQLPIDQKRYEEVLRDCSNLKESPITISALKKHGLDVMNVAWEDTGRNKFSSMGPNISDCTLIVDDVAMSVVRTENYSDLTFDVPMSRIPVMVGNERGQQELTRISLLDYLLNVSQYMPQLPRGAIEPMTEIDEDIIVSVQSCYLPCLKGSSTSFNGRIYNYQATQDNPSVLVILSSSKGTSAQIITEVNQDLFFNDDGKRCRFVAERLLDYREKQGDTNKSKEMSSEESAHNVIFMLQIPLKTNRSRTVTMGLSNGYMAGSGLMPTQKSTKQSKGFGFPLMMSTSSKRVKYPHYVTASKAEGRMDSSLEYLTEMGTVPSAPMLQCSMDSEHSEDEMLDYPERVDIVKKGPVSAGIEHAIVSAGRREGLFYESFLSLLPSLQNSPLTRDTRFPCRLTIQLYKTTDLPEIDEENVCVVADQIKKVVGDRNLSSLVTEFTDRSTEPILGDEARTGSKIDVSRSAPPEWDPLSF